MKRLTVLILTAAMALALAGCGDFAPDPTEAVSLSSDYSFDRSNFPALAGGTAQEPLAEAIAAIMLGEARESVSDTLSFGNTAESWAKLETGEAGLVLAAEPDELPAGVETAAVAKDALVFYVGAGSNIDDITTAQFKSIITGGTKSWTGMGGTGEIVVIGRPEGSGSLAALRRLIGADELAVSEEATALTSSEVLGYGFYSEAVLMGMADGYKILTVDGVMPTAETIASGEYPLCVDILAGISETAAEDSPERALWLWLQGGVGQAFISSQGYLEAAK